MAVIKGTTPDTLLKQAVVLDLGDISRQAAKLRVAAENQASAVLDKAEQQARQIIAEAEEKGREQGYAQGHEQGLAEGREQGHAEALGQSTEQFQNLVMSWSESLHDIEATRSRLESEIKSAALEFAIVFAEKLTHRVIEVDPTVVVDQLAQTLQYILRPLDVTVKVHPEDRAIVQQAVPELLAEFEQVQHIKLVDDGSVGRGGLITQYGQGQIDASIETQLDRLVEMMLPLDEQAKQAIEAQAKAAQAEQAQQPEVAEQPTDAVEEVAAEAAIETQPPGETAPPPDAVEPSGSDSDAAADQVMDDDASPADESNIETETEPETETIPEPDGPDDDAR